MSRYEEQIRQLIDRMTLKEKVGQLRQRGPSIVGAFDVSFEELLDMVFDGRISQQEFDDKMLNSAQDYHEDDIRNGAVGSYNGVKDAATARHLQKIAVEESRLGIPLLFGFDVIHGFRTITPTPIGESCSWDRKLWEKTARLAAQEASASGVHMTFAPMVDVARDARWGRICESAGEDVLLNCEYGKAKVKGFQGKNLSERENIAACIKHFAGYGAVEAGRDYNRVDMSWQKLYEEYLPPFRACIDAGARVVMPAFNDINGVPCSVNKKLLRKILRQDWGFEGMVISDSNAIAECVNHGVAQNRKEAAKAALEAGIDMDMASDVYYENLESLVMEKKIDEQLIDQAVANVLRLKFDLGLFENPYRECEERESVLAQDPESFNIAKEAADKSIVLLKNNGLLPLQPKVKLGIVGVLGNRKEEMTGSWAIAADIQRCVSMTMACKKKGLDYEYCDGIVNGTIDTDALKNIAQNCDVVIVALGELKEESGEAASRADLSLPDIQLQMVDCLLQLKKDVVVVLFNGRPLALPWIAENMPAVIEAWHPGCAAGESLMDIIMGNTNPSGKLTTTFPYTTGQCPMYYAHINTGRPGGKFKFTSKYLDTPLNPVYPFGYGLSYTTYDYSDLSVFIEGDIMKVTVNVTNQGNRDGEEIVQCYVSDKVACRTRPVRQLMGFEKIHIAAGKTISVAFNIALDALGYYDDDMNYMPGEGTFEVFVGKNVCEGLACNIILADE